MFAFARPAPDTWRKLAKPVHGSFTESCSRVNLIFSQKIAERSNESIRHMQWGPGKAAVEGQPIDVGGLNPWETQWVRLDEPPVELAHPSYRHQMHKMNLYSIESDDRKVVFAAAELSANVWGFYERLD